jgi:2-oxoglutarate dehydrogenase E2 component (dihydrolipoamide succinyltransferase)
VSIPALGESVTEGVIARWIKADGDAVKTDEPLLELETDKASVEIPATTDGVLRILKREGETVQVGEVVARIEAGESAREGREVSRPQPSRPPVAPAAPAGGAKEEAAPEHAAAGAKPAVQADSESSREAAAAVLSPAVRRLVEEHGLDAAEIKGSGRGGRLTKADVLTHLDEARPAPAPTAGAREELREETEPQPAPEVRAAPPLRPQLAAVRPTPKTPGDDEERVPMTRLRQRIAERLVQAQQAAAILTTFNEVDMHAVMTLRARHKARFAEVHGVPLGFMSFFAKACVAALHDLPVVNARIDGTDVVYPRHVHLGVAVSTERGLVVPVVHEADRLSFAQIEEEIERLAALARENKLGIADLSGGTFTISNGGVFGSLLSTPILNPPQSAILGMHKIEKRPVVIEDQIVIRPMMYLALSYDHRLIDGEQAVTFLVRVKERIEDPTRLMLDV